MAASLTSSRSIKEIQNLLLCDVCKQTINEPKILSCSHSFCKACLENLVTQDKGNADGKGKKLDCPTCGSKTTLKPDENVAGLPDNEFAIKLLAAVGPNRRQEASVCSFCDIKEASIAICMECELVLCQSCCGLHDKWPIQKKHILLSLDEIINRDEYKESGAENLSCTEHKDVIPKLYCETCRELICMKCVASIHKKPGHTCVAIHEIYQKQQEAVKTKSATINAMLMQGKQAVETVNNSKATYEKTAKDIKVKHTAQKDEMSKTVEEGMNKILADKIEEVEKVYDPACQKLSVQAETISNYVQKVEKSLQRTNDVLKNSKLEGLLSAQKVIDDDIQTLQNERPQNLTTFRVSVQNPQSCMEKLCFDTMFENLSKKKNLTEYLSRWAENELGKKLGREELTEYFNQWAKSALGRKLVSKDLDLVQLKVQNTVILKNEWQLCEHLFSFLNYRSTPLTLCYRASRDGWSSQLFHTHCDYKAGTVVLVKVGNWIFGGYTDQTWQSTSSGQYKNSYASFLFSLRNPNNMQPFKCPIINGTNGNAIFCHPSYGATFGGHDLHIRDNANSYTNSCSNLGHTYQPPPGYQNDTEQTQSLFAGSYNFTPTEVEVFY